MHFHNALSQEMLSQTQSMQFGNYVFQCTISLHDFPSHFPASITRAYGAQ